MYTRLWWKDARQFWPIWAFLVLAAGAVQLLVHLYAPPAARAEVLGLLALGWACMYAFVVGAAAFAGEREMGTLRLLDLLPAPRRTVWVGKVSFALVTTAALAGLLLTLALLDTSGPALWRLLNSEGPTLAAAVLITGLAFSLLCSAMLSSPLLAAVASIALTVTGFVLTAGPSPGSSGQLVRELEVALAALVGSWVAFTWRRRRRLPLTVRFRSPIEVAWAGRPIAARWPSRERATVEAPRAPAKPSAEPKRTIASVLWSAARPRPRSRLVELRSLAWQTMRQGRMTWLILLAIGLIGPAQMVFEMSPAMFMRTILPHLWNGTIALVAGVSVFGLESGRRTHRMLAHHGARPGIVWLAKVATWCFGLVLIWAPQVFLFARTPLDDHSVEQWTRLTLILPLGFAVAVLCGMAIPSGITAGAVALVFAIAITFGALGLIELGMLPTWGLLVLPPVLLAVSWAWSGDWLLDRPAPGRRIRLALLLAGALGATVGGYASWRAWSVPDVGPITPPAAWAADTGPLPPDRDAAPLYREAGAKVERARALHVDLLEMPRDTASSRLFEQQQIVDLGRHREIFDLIRRATARPECRFFPPGGMTLRDELDLLPPLWRLSDALAAHALRALRRGDLDAAWDDILIMFRMARHESRGAMMRPALQAIQIDEKGLAVARDWADAPGQTPDRLRAAIAACLALPRPTPPEEVIRAEGITIERTIDLQVDEIRDWLADVFAEGRPGRVISTWERLKVDLITTPWERVRARRMNRRLTAEAAGVAALEPWQRSDAARRIPLGFGPDALRTGPRERSSPLVEVLWPNHGGLLEADARAEVGRRALVQILAIRAWQHRHGGRPPERLEDLVPEELPSLPLDPYSGRAFAYGREDRPMPAPPPSGAAPRAPEARQLVSLGPDRRGIVFTIPPLKTEEKRW
jgi:hypothetical protein